MIKYSKYLLAFCSLSLITACTDLEENLKSEITQDIKIPGISTSTTGGPPDPLFAVFGQLRGSGTAYHSSYYSVNEIASDEMCIAAKGGDWFDGGILIELHRHTFTPAHDFIKNAWNGSYSAINNCNELLAATGSSALDANQRAQVRALRAYFYMRLCDMFGNVKISTETNKEPAQTTRLEVYKFVESELLAALGVTEVTATMNLANSPLGEAPSQYRINRWGALGLLSKLYLNAGVWSGTPQWDKASIASGFIIDKGPYTLCNDNCKVVNLGRRPAVASDSVELKGYAAVFAPNNKNNQEHIFSTEYDEVTAGGMNFSQMNLHYSSQFTWNLQSQPWNGYATLEEFYNSYDNADVRKKNNFIAGPQLDFGGSAILDYASDDGDLVLNYTPKINELSPNSIREAGARPGKFSFKQFGRDNMDNDYPIVRLGEMYLVRAEAEARKANSWTNANTLKDVNIIRLRAKVPLYTATTLTEAEFLRERGREMFAESVRRTDLIRFGTWNNAWWEKPASNVRTRLFPIPQEQIDATRSTKNPLKQNDGY
jgi:starch-binding outer membrane protein, SusD/RagB family